MNTLAPEVFLDFSPHTKEPRSAKRWTRVVTRRGEKEKPLVTLDLNLTFMKKPRSGSEPRARYYGYFYKHAKQYDWSVWLVIPRGRWGQQLSVHKSSRFACVLHWFCFWQCFEAIWPRSSRSVFQLADVIGILPTRQEKSIIIQLIPDIGKYLYLTGYSYPHHVIILVVSSEVFGGLSSPRTAKPWYFSGRFEQWRLLRAQSAQRSLFLSIRKTLTLLTKREIEILAS